MPTGLDLIAHNKPLQEHWFRRIVAVIIDWIIVSPAFWIVYLMGGRAVWLFGGLFMGIAWLLYFAVLETAIKTTIGKSIMRLEVMSLSGDLTLDKTFIRNLSKIVWVFLLLDWLLGMASEGDPRQRYLDRIAETVVVPKGGS